MPARGNVKGQNHFFNWNLRRKRQLFISMDILYPATYAIKYEKT
jgi:hypothetical protein